MANHEIMLNLIRLLKQGFTYSELVNNYDYSSEDVRTAIRIIKYLEKCNCTQGLEGMKEVTENDR